MFEKGPSTSAMSDASLAAMIAHGGDGTAEAELCARFRPRVYLYGLKHLRDAADAEDLAQEVLATVLERVRAGSITEPEKLASFVLGVCRMTVLGRRRGESRRARILARYGDPRIAAGGAPGVSAAETEDLARVRDCMARLSDRDRTVLLLSFYSELDAEALGREIGADPSHVRVIRHRALGRLRTCVSAVEEDR